MSTPRNTQGAALILLALAIGVCLLGVAVQEWGWRAVGLGMGRLMGGILP